MSAVGSWYRAPEEVKCAYSEIHSMCRESFFRQYAFRHLVYHPLPLQMPPVKLRQGGGITVFDEQIWCDWLCNPRTILQSLKTTVLFPILWVVIDPKKVLICFILQTICCIIHDCCSQIQCTGLHHDQYVMFCINFVFYITMYYNNPVSLKKPKTDSPVHEIFLNCINISCLLIILSLRFFLSCLI